MNMSSLLTRLKMDLGIYTFALPFDTNTALEEVITVITLPVFSVYCPLKEKFQCNVKDLKELEHTDSYQTYLLPDWKYKQIIDVEDVEYDNSMMSGVGYAANAALFNNNSLLQQTMLGQAGINITRAMIPKLTFQYEHPRKLRIYNLYNSCRLVLSLLCQHHPSLASIPPTQEQSFYQLALLDSKIFLYNALKHYNEIETAYGRITLKIDDWSDAKSERDQLIEKWDDTFHLDRTTIYFA